MTEQAAPIQTPLGAGVGVYRAAEHLGPGAMIFLGMQDPADPRTAEVYLDPDSVAALREALAPYEDTDPEEERTLGTPEDAVALVRDLAENLDTLLSGWEPEDWRDAVRVLHSLRRGIERLKVVDAGLVRWVYLHGEHGQHQTLDGVGPFSITRGRAKERWDVQGAAREYVETMIRRNDGEMPDPLQVLSWVLEVVSSSACRKTPIRALGLDVEDYYSSEPGTIQVSLPR